MKKLWTISDQVMKKYEEFMRKSWIIHEQVMNNSWANVEQVMSKSWAGHEQVMRYDTVHRDPEFIFLNLIRPLYGGWIMKKELIIDEHYANKSWACNK